MELRTIPAPASDKAPPWQRYWEAAYPCETGLSLPYPRVPVTALLEARRTSLSGPNSPAPCTADPRPTRSAGGAGPPAGPLPGRHWAPAPAATSPSCCPTCPNTLIALQAVWLTGATVLQLSPLMVAEEVSHWLEATGCTTVITLDLLAPLVRGALERGPLEHVIFTTLRDRVPMWRGWLYRLEHYRRNHIAEHPRGRAQAHLRPPAATPPPLTESPPVRPEEDVAVMVPTGGTTASPKAVMLTHRNLSPTPCSYAT